MANVTSDLGAQADLLKKTIDGDKSMQKADKQAITTDLDQFKKLAGTVKSRLSDGKPASAEARQMVDLGTRIGRFVGAHQLAAAAPWGSLRSGLDTLTLAFGG